MRSKIAIALSLMIFSACSHDAGAIASSQKYETFTSRAGGYSLELPVGWSRSAPGTSVSVADEERAISVVVNAATAPRTVSGARKQDLPGLSKRVVGFEEVSIVKVGVPAGPAVRIRYRKNNLPLPGEKAGRIQVDRYEIYSDGKLALVSLAGPATSDNSKAWDRIIRSFAFT